jgi:hypothetical protein
MNELKPHTIPWNKENTKYEAILDDPNHIRILFSDNTFTVSSRLIEYGGVRSFIRKQIQEDSLNYLDVWAINEISSRQENPFLLNQTVQIIDGRSRLFI